MRDGLNILKFRRSGIIPLAAHFYREMRALFYILLGPFDFLFRKINQLDKYPPIHLRRHAGCLGSMDGPGFEFAAYIRILLKLKAGHRLWDVGCGCGLLELAFERAGWKGSLIAVDIHKPSIEWAQRTISQREPNYRFIHADIYNPAYWPKGRKSANEWFSSFAERDFDSVVVKSLFTHMLPEELEIYLHQIGDRLKPTGKALLTFFLLNQ